MTQSEPTFYLKNSSIYNKILQLVLALVLILVLSNLWLSQSAQNQQSVDESFALTGNEFVAQASIAVGSLLLQQKSQVKAARKVKNKATGLQDYINRLGQSASVRQVHLYDVKGKLIAQSERASSVKTLYGLSAQKNNLSAQYVPFVQEIRSDKLHGYLRITLAKSYLTAQLKSTNQDTQALVRFMFIMALAVGFLLTRGLNRFSRRGFRLATRL